VLDDGNKIRVLPIVGRGSVQSVADILFLQGVDLGIVRADTLDYLERKGFAKDIKKQFTYVTKLYNEEMQVIAPKSVATLKDLEGKTVSVDLPNGGTFVTALTVAERLGMKANFVYIEQRIAMEKLKAGQIDALQEQDVGDALHRAAADDREHTDLVAVVEHGGEVGAELHIGAADRAGDQRDSVGVQRLLGRGRAELEDGPQAVRNLGRIVFGLLGACREGTDRHDGGNRHSQSVTHDTL
jgi:hypothetical protein